MASNVYPMIFLHKCEEVRKVFWAGIEISPAADKLAWPCCYFAPNGFEASIGTS